MPPFQALYSRHPPRIPDYVTGSTNIKALDDSLKQRQQVLIKLKQNLHRSRQQMATQANKCRRDFTFQVGDMVLLRLQAYRQSTVHRRSSQKLFKRFFGPFKVIQIVGKVAYELDLPVSSRIHPVIHISLLCPYHGTDPQGHFKPLPIATNDEHSVNTDTTSIEAEVDQSAKQMSESIDGKEERKNFEEKEVQKRTYGEKKMKETSDTSPSLYPLNSSTFLTKVSKPSDENLNTSLKISDPSISHKTLGPQLFPTTYANQTHAPTPPTVPPIHMLQPHVLGTCLRTFSDSSPPSTSSTNPSMPRGDLNLEDKVLIGAASNVSKNKREINPPVWMKNYYNCTFKCLGMCPRCQAYLYAPLHTDQQ